MSEKVLVTAAYRGELDHLDGLPENWIAQPCGIGGVAAAAGLSMLMAIHTPRLVVVLGTCGALGRGLSIGSLLAPRLVRWVDPGVLNGTAHMPPNVYKPLQINAFPDLPKAICLQTPSVTLAADHATRLATMSEGGLPAVEHLELYSMAFVANMFGVPITAILGVTNSVGPTGHRDWLANHVEVEGLIQEALLKSDKIPSAEGASKNSLPGPMWPPNSLPILDLDDPSPAANSVPAPAPGTAGPKPAPRPTPGSSLPKPPPRRNSHWLTDKD